MKKVLIVFGTRPEVIKMAPIIRAVEASPGLDAITCATAQHRHLLDQVLEHFAIQPDIDLNLMKQNQDLFDITINCLTKMKEVLKQVQPDVVLVQGDTTTAFVSGLAAFYTKTQVGHVEAGLRTWDKYAPFPEEMNRRMVCPLADYHFAPTQQAVQSLVSENVPQEGIYQTGNTSIDALFWTIAQNKQYDQLKKLYDGKQLILFTAHRRENFGQPMIDIFRALRDFSLSHPDFHAIYPGRTKSAFTVDDIKQLLAE